MNNKENKIYFLIIIIFFEVTALIFFQFFGSEFQNLYFNQSVPEINSIGDKTASNIRSFSDARRIYVWTSPKEISNLPMAGPGWDAILDQAERDASNPNIDDQDDKTPRIALAKAIACKRDKVQFNNYCNEAKQSLENLISNGIPTGRTLAWARQWAGFIATADLLDYQTPEFLEYTRNITSVWKGSQLNRTMEEMFEYMPNNWGSHAFASLAATYVYLGETDKIHHIIEIWTKYLSGPPITNMSWNDETSWMVNYSNYPNTLNPIGTTHFCDNLTLNTEGLLTQEMARIGPCTATPDYSGYPWEGIQGQVMATMILERQGPEFSILSTENYAMHRASCVLQNRLGAVNPEFKIDAHWNNDRCLAPILDVLYGTDFTSEVQDQEAAYGGCRSLGFGWVFSGLNSSYSNPPSCDADWIVQ